MRYTNFAVILATTLTGSPAAWAHIEDGVGYHDHMMSGFGFGGGFMGGGVMILFWAALIVGVILLVRWLLRSKPRKTDTALDILRERFARGEIDAAEYEALRKTLG